MNKLCSQTDKNTLFLSRWNDEAAAEITCHDQGAFFKEHEQGIDFDIVLERRPATNVFSYQVKSRNLAWHYQPALTRAEVKQGCARPENVVGSYAVYHQSKRHGVYETGKAFHVFRPMAVDRNGMQSWAQLRYRAGRLDIIVDPMFLRRAAYPVIVDPTFGYTTAGASNFSSGSSYLIINPLLPLSEAGTLTGMSAYADYNDVSDIQLGIYDSSGNLVAHTGAIAVPYPAAWVAGNLTTNPEKAAGNYYLAYQVSRDNVRVYYDSSASAESYQSCIYGTWPSTLSRSEYANWVFSLYVTYTVSGGAVTIGSIDGCSQAQAAATPSPTQAQNLAVDPGAQGQVAEAPTVTQAQVLSVEAAGQVQAAAEPVVGQVQQLAADVGVQSQTASTPAVTQVQVLALEPGAQSQAADQTSMTQVQAIAAEAGAQSQATDQPALTQVQELESVDPGGQSQFADEVILVWTPEGWVPTHICLARERTLVKRGSTRRFVFDVPERQLIFRGRP